MPDTQHEPGVSQQVSLAGVQDINERQGLGAKGWMVQWGAVGAFIFITLFLVWWISRQSEAATAALNEAHRSELARIDDAYKDARKAEREIRDSLSTKIGERVRELRDDMRGLREDFKVMAARMGYASQQPRAFGVPVPTNHGLNPSQHPLDMKAKGAKPP